MMAKSRLYMSWNFKETRTKFNTTKVTVFSHPLLDMLCTKSPEFETVDTLEELID